MQEKPNFHLRNVQPQNGGEEHEMIVVDPNACSRKATAHTHSTRLYTQSQDTRMVLVLHMKTKNKTTLHGL